MNVETLLYFVRPSEDFNRMDFDMNWWGLWVVPLGVALCFGPVIIAWAMACKADSASAKKDRR